MAGRLRVVATFLALACAPALAQSLVDPNFRALLNALMQGAPVALITPLSDGTVQVTSFVVPGVQRLYARGLPTVVDMSPPPNIPIR